MKVEQRVDEDLEIISNGKNVEENSKQIVKEDGQALEKIVNENTEKESDEESVTSENEGNFSPQDDESIASTIDEEQQAPRVTLKIIKTLD